MTKPLFDPRYNPQLPKVDPEVAKNNVMIHSTLKTIKEIQDEFTRKVEPFYDLLRSQLIEQAWSKIRNDQ